MKEYILVEKRSLYVGFTAQEILANANRLKLDSYEGSKDFEGGYSDDELEEMLLEYQGTQEWQERFAMNAENDEVYVCIQCDALMPSGIPSGACAHCQVSE